jgi:hypothetical protein
MQLVVLSLIVLLAGAVGKSIRESDISTAGRYDYVVSVPDIHGDLEALLRSLWLAKVEIDGSDSAGSFENFTKLFEKGEFLGITKRVLIVQTGDIVDRGAQSLSCYKAMDRIDKVLGWDLVNLIGNHEVMTMAGQADHYAHENDIAEFGSLEARRASFSKGGPMWKKITDSFLFMVRVQTGNEAALFVHAGLDSRWLSKLRKDLVSVGQINEFLISELKKDPSTNFLSSASSPVWTRDLANGKEKNVCDRLLPKVLERFNVNRMIVGHTPQQNLMADVRCNSTLILADVAMSRWMGSGKFGNPSAFLFQLGNDGSILERIYSVYWKGAKEQSVDQLIYQPEPNHEGLQEL